ncbi:hypothetical protein B0H14DRAFT_2590373 [Mycena olivaceomarginata]|nr:hypothetical protein B0H14DRAFT_2590373 [Mycena olivaceomarginata]
MSGHSSGVGLKQAQVLGQEVEAAAARGPDRTCAQSRGSGEAGRDVTGVAARTRVKAMRKQRRRCPLIRVVKSERELNVSWEQGILKGVERKYTKGIGRAAAGQLFPGGADGAGIWGGGFRAGMMGRGWGWYLNTSGAAVSGHERGGRFRPGLMGRGWGWDLNTSGAAVSGWGSWGRALGRLIRGGWGKCGKLGRKGPKAKF